MFEKIVGNSPIKNILQRLIAKNALSHSLLFAGPKGVGKSLFALTLAEYLLDCPQHPDLHIYRPEGKTGMHSLTAMRQLSEEVYLAPFSGKRKIFIIDDADRMLSSSANALLKTFEEPTTDSLILLISSTPSALLPTILSRCFTLFFHSLSETEIALILQQRWQLSSDQATHIASQAQGSLSHAIRLLKQGENSLRTLVLKRLSQGLTKSYHEIISCAQKFAAQLEEAQSLWEKELKAEILQNGWENLTASQKQEVEKEVEGAIAIRLRHEVQALLDQILGWYRDMQLIKVNGPRHYLLHRDFEEELEQALQRGELRPLEKVQQVIADARLALERSTSLSLCFENVLLRLNFSEV
jgi:DNA polymerase-3 subunit delta'